MSHSKKSRKNNPNGPKHAPRIKKEDRPLSVKKQKAGNRSGSRHNTHLMDSAPGATNKPKDPRHGSKKAIALELPVSAKQNTPKKIKQPKLSDEQLLLKLEEDPKLNQLLDQLEEGRQLNSEDQAWLEIQLDKIETLMDRLGITEEDDLEQIVQSTATATDDELFDKLETGADLLKQYQEKE